MRSLFTKLRGEMTKEIWVRKKKESFQVELFLIISGQLLIFFLFEIFLFYMTPLFLESVAHPVSVHLAGNLQKDQGRGCEIAPTGTWNQFFKK